MRIRLGTGIWTEDAGLVEDARAPLARPSARRSRIALRLFLTVWLIYALHATTNVVRETYLAISIAERFSLRVDPYLGLHPDLFEMEGRGAYINNNPGASFLGAVPYALARPAIDALFALKPELGAPKPPAAYDDPRPNRTRFMNEARARGLDVRLGLAALVTQAGLMAPLGALAAVALFWFLRARLRDERRALWLALLYAFGTPIFFRSAFLNQNALVAHFTLFAFLALAWPRARPGVPRGAQAGAGALLGLAVLCDYSGAPLLAAFGLWVAVEAWRRAGLAAGLRAAGWYTLGALPPLLALLGYQWAAFGHPLWPAQRYMPATPYSGRGWNGMSLPTSELLSGNLFDLRYGLFAFCPLLLAALAAPLLRRRPGGPTGGGLALIFGASAALWLFNSANQYALLQWNTGVRYLVPAGSLLFLAAVPVLLRLRPVWTWTLVVPTVAISWCVSMARESVPVSLANVFLGGFELPVLTVLQKMSSGYAPFLADRAASPLPIFLLAGVVLWLLWRGAAPQRGPDAAAPVVR